MKPMENGCKVPTLQTSKTDGCKAAGGHFNPFNEVHGGPTDPNRHVGDLGNIVTAAGASSTFVDVTNNLITLFDGTANIVDRMLVIHAGEDDFSGASGNAGSRVACGIVELTSS